MAEYKTPGVYIVELDAFPNTIVAVETAVPVFIGYTQMAVNNKKSLLFKPTRITTLAEYEANFGGAPATTYDLKEDDTTKEFSFTSAKPPYRLYNSLRLYFANGGGPCYIVSVGNYFTSIDKGALLGGLTPLLKEQEPTMVVIPDAMSLGDKQDSYDVFNQVLAHCEKMQSRVAILDVYDGFDERGIAADPVNDFRDGINVDDTFKWGAAYYPWLNTSIIGDNEFDYRNLSDAGITFLQEQLAAEGIVEKDKSDKLTVKAGVSLNEATDAAVDAYGKEQAATAPVAAATTKAGTEQTTYKDVLDAYNAALTTLSTADAVEAVAAVEADPGPPAVAAVAAVAAVPAFTTALASLNTELKLTGDNALTVTLPTIADTPESLNAAQAALDAAAVTIIRAWAAQVKTERDAGTDATGSVNALKNAETTIEAQQKKAQAARTTWNNALAAQAQAEQLKGGFTAKVDGNVSAIVNGTSDNPTSLHLSLMAVSPTYRTVMQELKKTMNVMPPAAAMAGVYARTDNNIGVFQAPANTGLISVVSPTVNINHDEQEDLNMPLTGKAVNAIRSFPGYGVLVWGARTLDGNSQDWRYISVRRTLIMIEQSVKIAMQAYVFEPNVASTWSTVNSMITNFLTNQWKAGALAGATPPEAFEVHVGLGATMTPNDILDGFMRVTVKVALVRPAEFIILTFQQKVQTS